MFVFVVPFKGRACCSDWSVASELCTNAIASMLATPSAIRVILVCSEPPDDLPSDPRLIVKKVFPPTPRTPEEMMVDKGFKIRVGLTIAREFAPTWLMRADADDRVSRKLVSFVEEQTPQGAWYAEVGWMHRIGSSYVIKQRDFHTQCGTSCITYVLASQIPLTIDEPLDESNLFNQPHHTLVDFLKNCGVPTRPIPFPTTLYVTDSGENHSGPWLTAPPSRRIRIRHILNTRPLTRSLREEFGLAP